MITDNHAFLTNTTCIAEYSPVAEFDFKIINSQTVEWVGFSKRTTGRNILCNFSPDDNNRELLYLDGCSAGWYAQFLPAVAPGSSTYTYELPYDCRVEIWMDDVLQEYFIANHEKSYDNDEQHAKFAKKLHELMGKTVHCKILKA